MQKDNISKENESKPDLRIVFVDTFVADDSYDLFYAIRDKNYDEVKQLVLCNHDVNCKVSGGNLQRSHLQRTPTPLSYAISCGDVRMVLLLIGLGAEIDDEIAKNEARNSRSLVIHKIFKVTCIKKYLMLDVKTGSHEQVLKALNPTVMGGEAHPKLNEPDDETGDTVLHIAAKKQDFRMIQILMAAAPLLNIKNKEGKLPKECTTSMNIQRYLIAAEPPVAAWHNDIKQFQSFIDQKRDISKKIIVETTTKKCLEVSAYSTANFRRNRQILSLISEAESKPKAQWQLGFDFPASHSSSSVSTNMSTNRTPSLGLKKLQENARQLLKDKNYAQAAIAYTQLLDVYKKNINTSEYNKAIAYYGLGFSQFKNQQLQQAVLNLGTAVELEPTNDLYSKKLQECQEELALSQPSGPSYFGCIIS